MTRPPSTTARKAPQCELDITVLDVTALPRPEPPARGNPARHSNVERRCKPALCAAPREQQHSFAIISNSHRTDCTIWRLGRLPDRWRRLPPAREHLPRHSPRSHALNAMTPIDSEAIGDGEGWDPEPCLLGHPEQSLDHDDLQNFADCEQMRAARVLAGRGRRRICRHLAIIAEPKLKRRSLAASPERTGRPASPTTSTRMPLTSAGRPALRTPDMRSLAWRKMPRRGPARPSATFARAGCGRARSHREYHVDL
jgi:hypothetical protein